MNKNKIIIFDLDGTLYRLSGGSFLESKLNKKIQENASLYIQKKIGVNKKEAQKILASIKKRYGENISIGLEKEYGINRYKYFSFVWNIEPGPYIERYKYLEKILTRLNKEYQFLLISDAPLVWIKNILKELNIEPFFKGRILSGEGDERKIFGNRFINILKKYNLKPDQIIVVGDQEETDIIPAKKLGFKTVYINNRKSKYADVTIGDIKYLETAFAFLFDKIVENKYYKYALRRLNIENPYKTIVLNGSSSAVVFRYKNSFYKVGPTKQIEKEINIYKKFKKYLKNRFNEIFPSFKLISSSKGVVLYRFKFIGEYNFEDYLLSPRCTNKKEIIKTNKLILENLDLIYNLTVSDGKELLKNFFKELVCAIRDNIEQADLLDEENKKFLNTLKDREQLFVYNAKASLAHKDFTVGNIVIDNKYNSVYFIDPRDPLPYAKKSFSPGNIGIDLAGYYVSILRKELEYNKLFEKLSFKNIKISIEKRVAFYLKRKALNKNLFDLCLLFWYSVYLACRCSYCVSESRNWLYIEMRKRYSFQREKLKKIFDKE